MEEIKVYNTLKREKQIFKPIEEGKVKIYVCGVTPYNHPHIGNARPAVTWDIIRRYLEYIGYHVDFIQNFTDVDDKIINKANAEKSDWKTVSTRYIDAYFKVMDALHIRRADIYPYVSKHMGDIIDMVKTLIEKGHAYVLGNDVYYDISTFKDYCKLSGRKVEDMLAGARVMVNTAKRNPGDFALWKGAKPGEPFWESPWGNGRPGWHIECSVMSTHYLGATFDFHGGGSDLIFPHHENEIAQSECATGKQLAHYWLHNGFINVNNEKMSKSLGNFFTVRDVVKHFPYDVIRFFLLTGHYRSPINFSDELLQAAQTGLTRLRNCYSAVQFKLKSKAESAESADKAAAAAESVRKSIDTARTAFIAAMDDDLNTPDALAAIFSWVREVNTLITSSPSAADCQAVLDFFDELGDVLGLRWQCEEAIPTEILALVEARTQAKKAKNFTLADELRKQITEAGYTLMDTPQGPRIEKQHA